MRHLVILAMLSIVPLAVPATANAAPLDQHHGRSVSHHGHPGYSRGWYGGWRGYGWGYPVPVPAVEYVPVYPVPTVEYVPVPVPVLVPAP